MRTYRDATDSTYTLSADDLGKTLKVRVNFTDDASNEESLTSAASATVAAAATVPGKPGHLRVFPHDAQGLDLSWEAPASDGGSPITGYKATVLKVNRNERRLAESYRTKGSHV